MKPGPGTRRAGTAIALILFIAVPLVALIGIYTQRFIDARSFPLTTAPFGEQIEEVAEEVADNRPAALRALDDALFAAGSSLNSRLGIAVVDVDSGTSADFNGDELMPQQSVSKLWVALAALDLADRGTLDLAETATVRASDLTLFHQPIRKRVLANGSATESYAQFMHLAMVGSDNTANDMLLKRVGGAEVVRSILAQKGLDTIRFGPGERVMQAQIAALEWDQRYSLGKTFFEVRKTVPHATRRSAFNAYVDDPVDGASALSLARALARLAKGELLSAPSTERLIGLMRDAKSGPNRLKGGIPEGWAIAHKTGTGQVLDIVPPGVIGEQAGYNDIGILTAPDGRRYAVAVMIGRTKRPVPERMDMMHTVVAAVVRYHSAVSLETGSDRNRESGGAT